MTTERSRVSNGRFLYDLSNWDAGGSAVWSVGDGDDHYGVAVLPTPGGYIEQDFTVANARLYSLHLSVKAISSALSGSETTLEITSSAGDTVVSEDLTGTADTWTEQTYQYGLAPGDTYTLKIINNSATDDVRIDDVWLWWCPITRANIATRVHAKLTALATGASLSTTPSGTLTEGDYTYAIDAGLRTVGAINPETDLPDIRYLDTALIDTVLDEVEREILERLQRYYATAVDTQVGSRRESLSQISKTLADLAGGKGGSTGKVVIRKLTHEASDYEFG